MLFSAPVYRLGGVVLGRGEGGGFGGFGAEQSEI